MCILCWKSQTRMYEQSSRRWYLYSSRERRLGKVWLEERRRPAPEETTTATQRSGRACRRMGRSCVWCPSWSRGTGRSLRWSHLHSCESKNEVWFIYLLSSYTVEPHYKEVGYNKTSYNKVILLVPALYISLFFCPDIMRNLIITRQISWSQGPRYKEVPLYYHFFTFRYYLKFQE